jgi:hypothetical protein
MPIGFLATRGDQITFIATTKPSVINAAFEKIPDLVGRFMDRKKMEKEEAVAN